MAEAMISSAVISLIRTQMERRPSELRDAALALALRDPLVDGATTPRWHIHCSVGIGAEIAAHLADDASGQRHPIAQVIHEGKTISGDPIPDGGPALYRSYWCAAPASLGDSSPHAVMIGLAAHPFTMTQRAALEQVAAITGAILAGAETALHQRRENEQLALLMSYAANPIILSDGQTIVSMNEPAQRLFDTESAIAGDNWSEQQGIITHNFALLQDFFREVRQAHDTIHSGELALHDPQTQEELIMAIACTHAPNADHGEDTLVSVLHDMTRARELEHHRIRQQLFESEKMAATGRLAASIAHEINNPLEAIKNSLYLLVRQTEDDDPNRQFLQIAQRETERVSRIIRQMLGVSRPSVAFAPTQINDVMQEALQLLEPQLRQGRVTLAVQLGEELPLVQASADQIKQVFLNLLLNAKEAMQQGGELLVQTRIAHEGDAEFLAGRHVIVRIRDDGAGIPAEILPHVFEPFFSTKAERHGTGLGLWVCQDIIQQHGGHILVRSLVGKGTTFLVALPFIPPTEPEGPMTPKDEGARRA